MPDVGVFGDQPKRLPLPAAADQDRDVAEGLRIELAQPGLDARQGLGQVVEAAARGAELVAVFVVILLLPTGSDPEDQAAVGDVVDRAGHVGEQFGVAVGVACNQGAELNPRRLLGPRAQHRPAFVMRSVGVAVQREEVVPVEGDVDADVLTAAHRVAEVAVLGRVLGLQLHADANGEAHGSHVTQRSDFRCLVFAQALRLRC